MLGKLFQKISIISVLVFPLLAQANGYLGQWHTVNEKNNKKESLVTIWEEKGVLKGKIEQLLDPESRESICDQCKGEKKNQKIEGMVFIWGMEQDGENYDDGKILDPSSGDIYSASMKLRDNGKKLEVRGYMGFALLGRSQIWLRAE